MTDLNRRPPCRVSDVLAVAVLCVACAAVLFAAHLLHALGWRQW